MEDSRYLIEYSKDLVYECCASAEYRLNVMAARGLLEARIQWGTLRSAYGAQHIMWYLQEYFHRPRCNVIPPGALVEVEV